MIQAIGIHEDPHEWLDMMEARLRGMEELSSTHITWYTHKNKYGCWICDMFLLNQRTIDSFREFLGPTPVDVPEGQTTLSLPSNDTSEEEDSEINDEEGE